MSTSTGVNVYIILMKAQLKQEHTTSTDWIFQDFFLSGVLPINGVMGMCQWMGSHFHDRTDYVYWVAFSTEFLTELLVDGVANFQDFEKKNTG